MAHGPFDQIAGAFLDAPTPVRAGAASARRTLALVGHMPMPAGLWLRQVADQLGRESGPVGLLRLEQDAVQMMIFRGAGLCPPVRTEATLADALRAVAGAVVNWLVVPDSSEEIAVPDGTTEALLLTSADEPAVLAGYTLLKKFVAARGERASRARMPGVAVEILGAPLDDAAHAAESLAATAREFLEIDVPFRGSIHRIAPVEPTLQRTFDVQSPSIAQVYAMLRDAESRPEQGAPAVRGDRFGARPERVPPRRTVGSHDTEPIPFLRPSTVVSPAPASAAANVPTPLPPRVARGPAPVHAPARPAARGESPERLRRFEIDPPSAAAPAPIPSLPPTVAASITPDEATLQSARATLEEARAALADAARSARDSAVPPPHAVATLRARAIAGELPQSLVPELDGLSALPFRAPRESGVELAVDGRGRMHLVGRAGDATSLLRVRAWAVEHAEILRLADARLHSAEPPALDLVVSDLREARAIDGATVHVLTLVELGGQRGYLAQVAPG